MLSIKKKIVENNIKNLDPLHVYLFDCSGLVVLKNVFPKQQIEQAKKTIDKIYPNKKPWKFSVLSMGEIFWDILSNKVMLAIAEQLCGDQFRLDHAFSVTSDEKIINLHGGPASSYGSCFAKLDNSLFVGQLSCGVPLTPQSPSTGGMCYIPGSHRSLDYRNGREIKKELLDHNLKNEGIVVPTLEIGDLVVFTESLVHGDTGWRPNNYSRMITYYKFSPGFMCWRDPREQEQYRHLARTDLERRLLEPPWSGQYSDANYVMDHNNIRKQKTLS